MKIFKPKIFAVAVIFYFISLKMVIGQTETFESDSLNNDSLLVPQESLVNSFPEEIFHTFEDLVHTPFNGFADILRDNNDVQVYDFMELGRPRYVAPLNMYPHQLNFYIDGLRMNDHINGMYNTRFISLDHVATISDNDIDTVFTLFGGIGKKLYVKRRFLDNKDAYTRLKFYEGDFQYTDLDIFFSSRYSEDLNIQLFGFNKGYAGSGFNNAHTGVNYNAEVRYRINPHIDGLFTFRLNHERAGMQNIKPGFTDYTYSGNDVEYGARLFFKPDSVMKNPFIFGFLSRNGRHGNKAGQSFKVLDRSDDYYVYLQKHLQHKQHQMSLTFSLDHHRMWGSAFTDPMTDARFVLDFKDSFALNDKNKVIWLANIEQMNDFTPQLNTSLNWQTRYNNFQTEFSGMYQNRYPVPVERAYNYLQYKGNNNLSPENIIDVSAAQGWLPHENILINATAGYTIVRDEIIFQNSSFNNSRSRDWTYLKGESSLKAGPFAFSAGGRVLKADQYISPGQAAWGELSYHDIWFNGVIVIDAAAHVNWFGEHEQILYNPIVQRFYTGVGKNDAYTVAGVKIVLTVSDAELFLEMDNLLEEKMVYIDGYDNNLRQVRFGVNWVMWN